MFKYIFGPVPSRRLGLSLGIDLVPKKVCSLNCIYCEVGNTTLLTTERKEYIPLEKIKEELTEFFNNNPDPDYFTFSGSGEPTLNIKIGEIIDFIKQKKPKIPVAVLTNGTLLYDKNVRQELRKADVVLPSLDAATKDAFRKINCPIKNLSIEKYIQGLIEFRKEYNGKIWLEVFILPGYNDGELQLTEIKKAILKIKPDLVQLNTLDRPGRIKWLKPATEEELQKIINFWGLDNVEIISVSQKKKHINSHSADKEASIIESIARRPCTLDDLSIMLNLHSNEIKKYLVALEKENKIERSNQNRGMFYKLKEQI